MENMKQRTKNPLSGLLEEYNSESDSEEKLQHSVNNFLSEIEEINQPSKTIPPKENFWQECFDKSTGYPYYWNTKTDEVTWDIPEEYKLHKSINNKGSTVQSKEVVKEPAINSSAAKKNLSTTRLSNNTKHSHIKSSSNKKCRTNNSDSDDEKITLISSYEAHSSSDEESTTKKSTANSLFPIKDVVETSSKSKTVNIPRAQKSTSQERQFSVKPFIGPEIPVTIYSISKDTLELDIISEIEKEKPPDLSSNSTTNKAKVPAKIEALSKPSVGFSLVAGYGDEEDDSETEETPPKTNALPFIPAAVVQETQAESNENNAANNVSHSTLFPNPTPIDISQFATQQSDAAAAAAAAKEAKDRTAGEEAHEANRRDTCSTEIDVKAFKRKRRIAMDVIATQSQKKVPKISSSNIESDREDSTELSSSELSDNARTGFGFSASAPALDCAANNSSSAAAASALSGAYKGPISFVKAETLNPSSNSNSGGSGGEALNKTAADGGETQQKTDEQDDDDEGLAEDLKKIETTVEEKLNFLCEGREPASAVQIMSIQLTTLSTAIRAKALSVSYLRDWLEETRSELVNLEKEAAPGGWLLKWDRSNKRYFYQNQHTNETQWEYPVVDIVGGSEAMDICTTPPPSDEPPATPPPPLINEDSPSPPPAPNISKKNSSSDESGKQTNEPLPPGIESEKKETEKKDKDKLVSELDSFYSDLATIESKLVPPVAPAVNSATSSQSDETELVSVGATPAALQSLLEEEQPAKKKKKTKVKISHGLTMKKKEVSKLVEKWKNVQKNYTD